VSKITREMKEWASDLFRSQEWRESAKSRILEGKAPHLEAHIFQVLMPKTDKVSVSVEKTPDLSQLSSEELAALESLLSKALPVPEPEIEAGEAVH
jgi:hypothetical protein